ncbi:protogenin A-like [Arapaima gigas]
MATFIRTAARRWLLLAVLPLSGVLCFSELFFITEPHDVTALRRDSVVLDCQARGEAPITVSWKKNGLNVRDSEHMYLLSNNSLYISEVENWSGENSDEGIYQCVAQNQYGSIVSQKARLAIASISAFLAQPVSIIVAEGSVARFTCRIAAHPSAIITWEFNQTALPLATERMTMLPSGVLQIRGVEHSDAGRYRCVASNIANRRRSSEATLTVIPAPVPGPSQGPQIIAGPQNLTVSLHKNIVLECLATGNPPPLISWSRADQKPMDVFSTRVLGHGNLVIEDMKLQHAGVYICRATMPGTRNYTIATANLTVLAPPSLLEWPESLTRPQAGTARFICQAEGVPTPSITWLKNGERLHSNGRIKTYKSKLVINQIIPEDDAIYQCLAENSQGSVLAMARLIVVMSEDRPSAPRNVRAETVSSSAILLAWDRPLYNADRVIAYSIHYMKSEGINNEEYQVVIGNDTTRYIIDDLEPAQTYTFYIVAYMPIGASRMSDLVIQHTLEDVPLRAPELSLTSHSPTDIQVSWQPLPSKLSRGLVLAYRLSLRMTADGAITLLELPGNRTQHLIEDLRPDTVYLLRIAAATRVGWGEPSAWTSHCTPAATSTNVPMAPLLQLEPLNCTTIVVRWKCSDGDATRVQGYQLSYREEGQPDEMSIQLGTHISEYTIGGLDPRRKYHIKLLAYSSIGNGYQTDQTASTRGCVSVRDRLVPPPPPPHRLYSRSNSSTAMYLQWERPAFTLGQPVRYTVRCNPLGVQNASLVLYLQTTETNLLVQGLEPNTQYEVAVRLHLDQLTSPWSTVAQQSTLPEAPTRPPAAVKVTQIERDMALVSWRQPEEPNLAVTHYTILYASRRAWKAGEWQLLQKDGSTTMALLENLTPGDIYLVRVSACNQVGDGPFSSEVELAIVGQNQIHNVGSAVAKAFFNSYHKMDLKSTMGIMGGVSIALVCILICAMVLVYRSKVRKSFDPQGDSPGNHQLLQTLAPLASVEQPESTEIFVATPGSHFIDTKGGMDLVINTSGPLKPIICKKKTWLLFSHRGTQKSKEQVQRLGYSACSYQPARAVLRYEDEEPPLSLGQSISRTVVFGLPCDAEGSHSSEGSQETGDSGHYSHDEADMAVVKNVRNC